MASCGLCLDLEGGRIRKLDDGRSECPDMADCGLVARSSCDSSAPLDEAADVGLDFERGCSEPLRLGARFGHLPQTL